MATEKVAGFSGPLKEGLFKPFPKIPRYSRDIIITEKIDGTNASIIIEPVHLGLVAFEKENGVPLIYTYNPLSEDIQILAIFAASRNRIINPGKQDNHGFAGWVMANATELSVLGPGQHFGEWWGQGIGRGYGLKEKRFSLFNTERWGDDNVRPRICGVVPILYKGGHETDSVFNALRILDFYGSAAAPGFMRPEGVVIYHTGGNVLFKKTLENDDVPKSSFKTAA